MGCTVTSNRHGRLALRLWWRGHRSWEGTGLADTPENRAKLERIAKMVRAEIAARVFDAKRYLHYFPAGTRAEAMRRELAGGAVIARQTPTLREFALDRWLPEQHAPLRRHSYYRTAKSHLTNLILDVPIGDAAAGELRLVEIDRDVVEAIRAAGLAKGRTVKTMKNAVSGTLRAVLERARLAKLIAENPTDGLRWQRPIRKQPDPLSEDERDRVLAHFARKHPRLYPLIGTLFLAGLRPSEATALRWSDVDLAARQLVIGRSRVRGRESATKTAASTRTIRITRELAGILRAHCPLDADVDTYVFRNAQGRPYEQDKVRQRYWRPALRALGIRPRKLYATRHTFISLALSRGANPRRIAEYSGTSGVMLDQSYARWMEHAGDDQDRFLDRRRRRRGGENGDGHQKGRKSA